MTHATQCPVDQLQPFLADALDASSQDDLVAHLDQCEDCRRRLEELAGSADDWAFGAAALASGDDIDLSGLFDDGVAQTSPHITQSDQRHEDLAPLSMLQILTPSDDPRAAGRIGPFEITGLVGTGGMGVVLKARDPALDRYVAIKILAPHLASSPSARQRFAREARAAAAVIHDNVIAIYQVAHWNDLPYLVMPYLPDPSLQERIAKEGMLDLESTLSIGLQIARGLEAAHSQGLVHRDVKPANVLLSKGTERAVITDFGLARASDDASLTQAGVLAGTPHYMSPEQARGESVDHASDLYSLGSVLFAMITGRPPVDSELASETIVRIAGTKAPSLREVADDIPDWLTRLVDWLHESNPRNRPDSADQVADLLEQCLAHYRQPNKTPLPQELGPRRETRTVSPLVSTMGAALLAIGALGVVVLGSIEIVELFDTQPQTEQTTSIGSVPDPLPAINRDLKQIELELNDMNRWLDYEIRSGNSYLNEGEAK